MATIVVRNAAHVAVLVAVLGALAVVAPAQQPESTRLAQAVRGFLTSWLVEGNAVGAAGAHLAPTARDERYVPAQYYRAQDYRRLVSPERVTTLSSTDAAARFGSVLQRLRLPDAPKAPSLQEALAPVDEKNAAELWGELKEMDIKPRVLPDVQALAFPLQGASSFDWIGTETVGYRTLVPQLIAKGQRVEGVLSRIRERGLRKPWLLFMFWSREGTGATESWKLLGLSPVLTE